MAQVVDQLLFSAALRKYRSQAELLRIFGTQHAARRIRAHGVHRAAVTKRRADIAAQMWREAAAELGARVREVAPALLEIRLGTSVTRVRGQTTRYADRVSWYIASDKVLSYRLMSDAGLPVPEHSTVDVRRVSDVRRAVDTERFLGADAGPWVVKPVHGGGGTGVTGEIRTASQLRSALVVTARFDVQALIERQVTGDSFRILVLDGAVLDVLRRTRPVVVGDGRSTIEELIFAEHARRITAIDAAGLKPFLTDLDCLFTLRHAGYELTDVPAPGTQVAVKTATNYNGPGQTTALAPPYPKPLVTAALSAAEALGVRLAGVDIITSDPAADLFVAGAVVLEVNPVPGLTHHYNLARPPDARPVAVSVLRSLLRTPPASAATH